MITDEHYNRIADSLPILRQADREMISAFKNATYHARIPVGKDIFAHGDRVDSIALLVSGMVRVYKIGETGREITLYRFGIGESCILTANAILSSQPFSATATVEQEAEAILIPADTFREWVGCYEGWRDFVFRLLSQRLSNVMEIVDEVAFGRMDIRVIALLLERTQTQNPLTMTHQEIAAELGSAREVISRILENLADRGLLRMGRGTIEVLDVQAMKDTAHR